MSRMSLVARAEGHMCSKQRKLRVRVLTTGAAFSSRWLPQHACGAVTAPFETQRTNAKHSSTSRPVRRGSMKSIWAAVTRRRRPQ